MPDKTPIVLLTRPIQQAQAFRELLGADIEVIISPIIEIKNLSLKLDLMKYSALVFASQNAVIAAAATTDLRGLSACVVGAKTAQTAESFGMSVLVTGDDADSLVANIVASDCDQPLMFLRGEHSVGNIAERLNNAGLDTDETVIYKQIQRELSARAVNVLRGNRPIFLPLFSPRSAAILSFQVRSAFSAAQLTLIAISDAVLAAWDGPEPNGAFVSGSKTALSVAEEIMRRIGETS